MANRPGAAWTLESRPWSARKAAGLVDRRLAQWGMQGPGTTAELVTLLVATAVADGGRRISLHLAEQNGTALVLALSHQPDPPPLDDTTLTRLRALGALSCGTETTTDGRTVWAVVALTPENRPPDTDRGFPKPPTANHQNGAPRRGTRADG
ncbi:hypothetical protein [Streptomyces yaizuensis]|uniref:ATP-binding protein n=1 Tax=Streptomyces yaizuensis TaxID=2989713 RepID=A0ABQ5NY70_9ACTN|nr:hypothetical protein [Streptomyces sp. YSPA8]GLF95324.1 hypothetical protein SYYSPA8_13525 [Streptomyces sp. YSPA8]